MPESNEVVCKFSTMGSGSRTCEGKASQFVRSKKTGRLVPLCGPCLKSFQEAQERLAAPGHERPDALKEVGYDLVPLGDGAQEWQAQPPKG